MESNRAESYVRRLREIDAALSRANKQVTELRSKKKEATQRLHEWMQKKGLDEYGGYSIKKVAPRPRAKRKPKKDKREDALRLFTSIGVQDPELLLEEYERTQKYGEEGED